MDTAKSCRVCDQDKALCAFDIDRRNRDGHSGMCKSCRRMAALKTRRDTLRPKANNIYQRAKIRARDKSLPFDLDIEWVEERLRAGLCEVTGIPFEQCVGCGNKRQLRAPSLDQVEAGKGYTKANVRMVLYGYNALKSTASADEARALLLQMAQALQ